jgi:CheY-like chemotaxis protein
MSPLSTHSPNKTRILVVEDEAVIAMDIEERLQALGYEVVGTAPRFERAVDLAGSKQPHLALMDINIQGDKDGIETARSLREQFDIPSVFLTAYSDDETIGRALGSNPQGYLVKPFVDREILAAIELALYKHRTERELASYRQQLEEKVEELEKALREVRELKALLPICAWCKNIRNEQGYWQEVSAYISEHTKTKFTHGLCDECQRKMFEEENLSPEDGEG